jgi:hypothetical protein
MIDVMQFFGKPGRCARGAFEAGSSGARPPRFATFPGGRLAFPRADILARICRQLHAKIFEKSKVALLGGRRKPSVGAARKEIKRR